MKPLLDRPKLNSPEWKLQRLLEFKMQIQEKETDLEEAQRQWRLLSVKVRSLAQKVGEMKKTLFEMI